MFPSIFVHNGKKEGGAQNRGRTPSGEEKPYIPWQKDLTIYNGVERNKWGNRSNKPLSSKKMKK